MIPRFVSGVFWDYHHIRIAFLVSFWVCLLLFLGSTDGLVAFAGGLWRPVQARGFDTAQLFTSSTSQGRSQSIAFHSIVGMQQRNITGSSNHSEASWIMAQGAFKGRVKLNMFLLL